MKKENIYKLVEMGYKGGGEYDQYISEFIKKLNDEKYFEMADYIRELQFKNSKVSFTTLENQKNKRTNEYIVPDYLNKKTSLILNGYKKNLIKKILLVGKPGTGKTSYVEYISKIIGMPLINVKISDILDYKYGESIKKLEAIMNEYRDMKCILFFDEADALFRKRGKINDIYETDRIVTTMLKELDKDFIPLIFFASNLYNELDKAIIRRMDDIVDFNNYNYDSMLKIWESYLKFYKLKLNDNDDIKKFIKQNNNFLSPSDLKNIAKKIAIIYLDKNDENISLHIKETLYDFVESRKEVNNEK